MNRTEIEAATHIDKEEKQELKPENTQTTKTNISTSETEANTELELNIEKESIINKSNFNKNINIEDKRRLGNTFAFFYKNGEPKIIIGPHCK